MIRILEVVPFFGNGGVEKTISNYVQNSNDFKFDVYAIKGYNENSIFMKDLMNNNVKIYAGTKRKYFEKVCEFEKFFNQHKEKYDIVHVNGSSAMDTIYCKKAKLIKPEITTIMHSHADTVEKPNYFLKLMAHNYFKIKNSKYIDYKCACSENAGVWMYNSYSKNKYIVIKNGIDVEKNLYSDKKRETFRKEIGLEEDCLLIGTIGRITIQKNPEYIFNIIKKLSSSNLKFKFLWIGDGNQKDKIENLIKENNLYDKVIMYGACDKVDYALSAMDIFVLPSIYEGNPIVGFEAQTSDLKCLFSNKITQKSKILESVEFIGINEEDLDKWVDKIKEFRKLKRKNNKKIMIENGYDVNTSIKKMYSIMKGEKI